MPQYALGKENGFMKASINQWAFPGEMPAEEAISVVKKLGFEAFEPCVGAGSTIDINATEKEVTAIRAHADKEGIELCSVGSGLGWKYALGDPDASKQDEAVAINERVLQIAAWLGAPSVLVVPATVSPEVPYDVALEASLEGVRKLIPAAERLKVNIALENVWNKFLLSPVEMRDFIDQCESEYVGAYFDTGNIVLYGYPEQWIRILGSRLCAIHAKDFRASVGTGGGFVMLMEGDVNWPAVMAALREVGFDGALTAEFGPYEHSRDVMLQHVLASLRAIIAL